MLDPDLVGRARTKHFKKVHVCEKVPESVCHSETGRGQSLVRLRSEPKSQPSLSFAMTASRNTDVRKLIVSTYGTTNATQVAETEHCNAVLPVEYAS